MADSDAVKATWIHQVLGVELGGNGSASGPALAGWKSARGAAVSALNALIAAVRAGGDPDADSAIILLRAIRANLTEAPATAGQVTALRTYLTDDPIVAIAELENAYGVNLQLRQPLLAALDNLQAALSVDA